MDVWVHVQVLDVLDVLLQLLTILRSIRLQRLLVWLRSKLLVQVKHVHVLLGRLLGSGVRHYGRLLRLLLLLLRLLALSLTVTSLGRQHHDVLDHHGWRHFEFPLLYLFVQLLDPWNGLVYTVGIRRLLLLFLGSLGLHFGAVVRLVLRVGLLVFVQHLSPRFGEVIRHVLLDSGVGWGLVGVRGTLRLGHTLGLDEVSLGLLATRHVQLLLLRGLNRLSISVRSHLNLVSLANQSTCRLGCFVVRGIDSVVGAQTDEVSETVFRFIAFSCFEQRLNLQIAALGRVYVVVSVCLFGTQHSCYCSLA